MKKFLVILLLIVSVNSINGQQCNSYALHWDNNLSAEFLVSIDPNTGAVTKIDSISNVNPIQAGFSAIDAQSGVYYFRGFDANYNGSLYSIDISNGSVIASPNFPPATINGNVRELQINPITGELFALHWDNNLSTEFLVSIDPNTGAVTIIDSISNVNSIQAGFSAIDAQSGVFYFRGFDANYNGSLYSIDISNGSVIASPNFPPATINGNVKELQINPITGELFALHWDNNLSAEFLVSIDPNTGAVTKIDSISNVNIIQFDFSAIDAQSGIFYFRGFDANSNGRLYSIDLNDGSVIANPNFPPSTINGYIRGLQTPNFFTPYINVTNASICNSGSSMLFISDRYKNLLWSNGDTTNPIYISDSAQYSVTLTTNYGCQINSNEISINVFDCSTFVDSLNYTLDTCLFDSTSIVMAYSNNITISNDTIYLLWNFITNNGDTIMLNANYYFTQNGVYTISVNGNCNGQKRNSDFFFDLIEINHLSIGQENNNLSLLEFNIFPNPTSDHLTILSDKLTINQINIIDVNGKILKTISTDSNVINIRELPSGIYFIKIIAEEKTMIKRFVKQ